MNNKKLQIGKHGTCFVSIVLFKKEFCHLLGLSKSEYVVLSWDYKSGFFGFCIRTIKYYSPDISVYDLPLFELRNFCSEYQLFSMINDSIYHEGIIYSPHYNLINHSPDDFLDNTPIALNKVFNNKYKAIRDKYDLVRNYWFYRLYNLNYNLYNNNPT